MKKIFIACFTILTSGSAFYFSTGFHNIWWLMWIAPIPVLIYAYYESVFRVLLVTLIVGLAFGLNNIVGYWPTSIPSSTFFPAMFWQSIKWTIVILLSRSVMRYNPSYFSIFAYPTCLALFEWLETFTIQGTFNTIAYSQLQILPVIQIASLTGYIGISFVLSLFSSTVTYAIIFRQEKIRALTGLFIGMLVVIFSLGYGYYLIHLSQQEKPLAKIKVGLISVSRAPGQLLNPQFSNEIFSRYLPLMANAVKNGEVRVARDGFLSVSTPTGEVIAKVPAMNPQGTMLITIAPIYQNHSFFAKHQWWFVIFLWLYLVIIVVYSLLTKKQNIVAINHGIKRKISGF